MRTFFKILGGLAIIGALGAGLGFWLTSGIADTGNRFFSKLREGDAKAAYELTSPGFRTATTLAAFEAYVKRTGLKTASAPSWSSRNVNGTGDAATGTLTGAFKDAKGNSIPARLQLTKNNGKWTVHHLRLSAGGVSSGAQTGTVPAETELIKLVHNSNLAFTKAIEAKDLKPFHAYISERWRKQISVEQLAKIFAPFTSRNAHFTGLEKLTPAFDGPARIDGNGIMRVTGTYDTRPMRIIFRQSYTREGLGWKLFGFGFNMKPPKDQPAK